MNDASLFFSPEQLADRWGVHPETIRRHLHIRVEVNEPVPVGKIPAMRIGRVFRIHVRTVEAWEQLAVVRLEHGAHRQRRKLVQPDVPNHLGDLD